MKGIHFIVALSLLLSACNNTPQKSSDTKMQTALLVPEVAERVSATPDTITRLQDMSDSIAFFRTDDGSVYLVTMSGDNDYRGLGSLNCDTDIFVGKARFVAKTTRLTKTYEQFNTLADLRSTLQADSLMRNHTPKITSDSASVRVSEEKRNVTVKTCWLYAIKREDDGDFHLILGTDTTPTASELLNVEVSGLPDTGSASFATLKSVRDTFENRFGEVCKSSYTKFTPPMKVLIKGSLFYDIDHAPGIVGPLGYRPNTSWEIHPVTKITFK